MRGRKPKEARNHFFALRAIHSDMRGLILLDSDNKEEVSDNREEGKNKTDGLINYEWKRYEIENYLIHKDSIERFAIERWGNQVFDEIIKEMQKELPGAVMNDPLSDHNYLKLTPASKELLPKFFKGLEIVKADYYQIAEQMEEHEIHKDVKEFFDLFYTILRDNDKTMV